MARAANIDEYRRSKVTIHEIADLAGVSIATVSRVVNGRDDVAPETRELVMRVIRERVHDEPQRPGALGRPNRPRWSHDSADAR
jgi:transcriptional regulator with XRE-family HTH domain